MEKDLLFMKEAYKYANIALKNNEVPVGAVIVKDGEIVSFGYNSRETERSAIAHAEIMAIETACLKLGSRRLNGCTLYVTLEPCPMCTGAIVNSKLDRVVFGAKDTLYGCCGSVLNFNAYPFGHSFEISSGIMEKECRELLQNFFREKREHN